MLRAGTRGRVVVAQQLLDAVLEDAAGAAGDRLLVEAPCPLAQDRSRRAVGCPAACGRPLSRMTLGLDAEFGAARQRHPGASSSIVGRSRYRGRERRDADFQTRGGHRVFAARRQPAGVVGSRRTVAGKPAERFRRPANFPANFWCSEEASWGGFRPILTRSRPARLACKTSKTSNKIGLFTEEKGLESWRARQDSNLRPSA